MKSLQRGGGAVRILVTLALLVGSLLLILPNWLPAQAEDLQTVIALAAPSAEAKAALSESLIKTPKPTVAQLGKMKSLVNEILVTETVRSVTGDGSLQTATVLAATQEADNKSRMMVIESKDWDQMSDIDRVIYILLFMPDALIILGVSFLFVNIIIRVNRVD